MVFMVFRENLDFTGDGDVFGVLAVKEDLLFFGEKLLDTGVRGLLNRTASASLLDAKC